MVKSTSQLMMARPCLKRIMEISPYFVHWSEGRLHLRLKSFWVSSWLVVLNVIIFTHINCWTLKDTNRVIMFGIQRPKAQARIKKLSPGLLLPLWMDPKREPCYDH